jgi:hypothetical protein
MSDDKQSINDLLAPYDRNLQATPDVNATKDQLDEDLLSTYNPKPKWDCYEIGGRFQGLLILKNEKKGLRGTPGSTTEMTEGYDGAFVSDVDFEAMKRRDTANLPRYEDAMKKSFIKEAYMRERFPTEKEYIERETTFSTYTVITPDGKWHSQGEIGWWGDTAEEERAWQRGYHDRFIKPAIENNWYMVIVDCHI